MRRNWNTKQIETGKQYDKFRCRMTPPTCVINIKTENSFSHQSVRFSSILFLFSPTRAHSTISCYAGAHNTRALSNYKCIFNGKQKLLIFTTLSAHIMPPRVDRCTWWIDEYFSAHRNLKWSVDFNYHLIFGCIFEFYGEMSKVHAMHIFEIVIWPRNESPRNGWVRKICFSSLAMHIQMVFITSTTRSLSCRHQWTLEIHQMMVAPARWANAS